MGDPGSYLWYPLIQPRTEQLHQPRPHTLSVRSTSGCALAVCFVTCVHLVPTLCERWRSVFMYIPPSNMFIAHMTIPCVHLMLSFTASHKVWLILSPNTLNKTLSPQGPSIRPAFSWRVWSYRVYSLLLLPRVHTSNLKPARWDLLKVLLKQQVSSISRRRSCDMVVKPPSRHCKTKVES